jgi:hypothetical protein
MDDLFTAERRRVVSYYNDARWVTYCGYCGVRKGACHCGTGVAGATYADVTSTHGEPYRIEVPPLPEGTVCVPSVWTERAICRCGQPVVGNEWHMCIDTVRQFGDDTTTTVSLPSEVAHEPALVEETQVKQETWRDRPPLL